MRQPMQPFKRQIMQRHEYPENRRHRISRHNADAVVIERICGTCDQRRDKHVSVIDGRFVVFLVLDGVERAVEEIAMDSVLGGDPYPARDGRARRKLGDDLERVYVMGEPSRR